jgi:hypothetical protein
MRWTVGLPYGVSINRSQRNSSANHRYTTKEANEWRMACRTAMRDAGMHSLRGDHHYVTIAVYLWTESADVDAHLKSIIDCVAEVLQVNDKWVGIAATHKKFVRHHREKAIVIEVMAHRIQASNDDETKRLFNQRAEAYAAWPENPTIMEAAKERHV